MNSNAKSSASSSAAGADAPARSNQHANRAAPPLGDLVQFGEVGPLDTLRANVRNRLAILTAPNQLLPQSAEAAHAASTTNGAEKRAAGYSLDNPGATATIRVRRASIQACITSVAKSAHLRSDPVLAGIGTSATRPVFVVVFARASTHIVYVLSAADCSVVTRTTLP
jgi:hypothetical protein